MAPDEIRDRQRAQPFVPFRVHLSNGMQFDVRHPEMMTVGDEAMVITVYNEEKDKHLLKYISIININVIEPIPEAERSAS